MKIGNGHIKNAIDESMATTGEILAGNKDASEEVFRAIEARNQVEEKIKNLSKRIDIRCSNIADKESLTQLFSEMELASIKLGAMAGAYFAKQAKDCYEEQLKAECKNYLKKHSDEMYDMVKNKFEEKK